LHPLAHERLDAVHRLAAMSTRCVVNVILQGVGSRSTTETAKASRWQRATWQDERHGGSADRVDRGGSPLAGSGLTGWFTARAGRRQAIAAEYAGDKQAEALLVTVRQTLDEQHTARVQDVRRAAYTDFLMAADHAYAERKAQTVNGPQSERPERLLPPKSFSSSLASVAIEGPSGVEKFAAMLHFSLNDERWRAGFPLARPCFRF
jgi:hypothetical protein